MKIAFVSQNASPGILIFRKDIIKHFISKGDDVYCFALDYTPETKKAVYKLGAIPVEYNLNRASLTPFRDLLNIFLLYRIIRKIEPDIVFSFFIKPSIYGTLAAALARVPRRVAMIEGLGYIYTPELNRRSFKKELLKKLHGFLCSVSYSFAQEIIFLNRDDPADLRKNCFISDEKIKTLGPIGLDLKAYPHVPVKLKNTIRFIFVARLLEEKGIYYYLAAARKVKKIYQDVEFVVLGGLDLDNPNAISKKDLESLVEEGIIIYPGHVKNVMEWLSSSHVFVLPSFYREGIPRSTQEAMAIGRAIITTDVPGCRETVIDGVSGFLVPPWDEQAIYEKMLYFVENKTEIIRMGYESHQFALKHFDVRKINKNLASIITGE